MGLTKFDPWRALHQPGERAYRDYVAYSEPDLGASGTAGTPRHSLIDAVKNRSAVIEMGNKSARRVAKGATARACGYGSGLQVRAATVAHWRCRLRAAAASDVGRSPSITTALALVNGPWIDQLVALGWDEVALFASGATGPDECDDAGLITVLGHGTIVAASTDTVAFVDGVGVLRRHFRITATRSARLIWEAAGETELS
jgi:hypothetical protein